MTRLKAIMKRNISEALMKRTQSPNQYETVNPIAMEAKAIPAAVRIERR
jgi:hypothetical protein